MLNRGRLVVACADRPGIVAAISGWLFARGANIVHSDQHSTDPADGHFFLRVEFDLDNLREREADLNAEFTLLAETWGMEWRIALASRLPRIAVFASHEDHAVLELLWRRRAGDLRGEIAMVIGNHAQMGQIVAPWNVPFVHVPVVDIAEAELRQTELLTEANIDLVVLARYMQILSPAFISGWRNRIINIHHSFLPAFVGANPYARAAERGVKLIGATAHYVTDELDAGPIIEQDVHRVDHRHATADLRRIGRQVERAVLARAVAWHVQDRILVNGDTTIVFA